MSRGWAGRRAKSRLRMGGRLYKSPQGRLPAFVHATHGLVSGSIPLLEALAGRDGQRQRRSRPALPCPDSWVCWVPPRECFQLAMRLGSARHHTKLHQASCPLPLFPPPSPAQGLFAGQSGYETVCQECGRPSESSARSTLFYELDVPVKGFASLQGGLVGALRLGGGQAGAVGAKEALPSGALLRAGRWLLRLTTRRVADEPAGPRDPGRAQPVRLRVLRAQGGAEMLEWNARRWGSPVESRARARETLGRGALCGAAI